MVVATVKSRAGLGSGQILFHVKIFTIFSHAYYFRIFVIWSKSDGFQQYTP